MLIFDEHMVLFTMDSQEFRTISAAVTTAVTEAVSKTCQDQPCSSSGKRSIDDESQEPSKKKKKALLCLPPNFRQKKGKGKKVQPEKTYTKDIVCLPHSFHQDQEILYPKGNKRTLLATSGLLGKVTLSSNMTEEEIQIPTVRGWWI